MPKSDSQRDLNALIKATEDNRAELKKRQQKVENLESAIRTMQNSRIESEQKRGKRNSKLSG
jgi:hypothetical protein